MLGEKEAQSKWGGPRLPGEDALGEGADVAGLRGLGVTLNTGEGGRRGGPPHGGRCQKRRPSLLRILGTDLLQSGVRGLSGKQQVAPRGSHSVGFSPGRRSRETPCFSASLLEEPGLSAGVRGGGQCPSGDEP